nr:DUF4190 domain-containing protein [Neobacillus sp. Marseille-Q6967]
MADEKDTKVRESLQGSNIGADIPNKRAEYREETSAEIGAAVPIRSRRPKNTQLSLPSPHKEETAAEIAAPVPIAPRRNQEGTQQNAQNKAQAGTGIGWAALALSILSLFVMPILFGAAGIVLGFIARRRGAEGLGAWAIGIGALSIIVGMFILPFF